jgi:hypothetical protein
MNRLVYEKPFVFLEIDLSLQSKQSALLKIILFYIVYIATSSNVLFGCHSKPISNSFTL